MTSLRPRAGSRMADLTSLLAGDPHDERLRENVHPPGWANPTPAARYDLVVIGAGTAGLVSAGVAGLLGAKVALVERGLVGGDCLVSGCVPSKALIRAGRAAHDVRTAGAFGVRVPPGVEVDVTAAMDRMRRVRAQISRHDAVAEFSRTYGVDVFLGAGRFSSADALEVDGIALQFNRAIIATGARPAVPDIPRLAEGRYFTNETVFNLTERPARVAVLGGGPIGCELAQGFARMGSRVTLIERGGRLLGREDADVAELLERVMRREGIELRLTTSAERVELRNDTTRSIVCRSSDGIETHVDADALLVAVGRTPNVQGLNLEAAAVAYDRHGVTVDDRLRTTNPRVFAAGDVCLPRQQFTHAADASARVAVQNALLLPLKRWSRQVVPWVTYTDPEIARVGLSEAQAAAQGIAVRAQRVPFTDVDRAMTDGETEGFVKILTRSRGNRIAGATIVGRHSGETISQITTAMVHGIGLKRLSEVIHPYPTQAEAIRKAADAYVTGKLGPALKWGIGRWLALRRR